MAKPKKQRKPRKGEREFPETIHVAIDPNLRDTEPLGLQAYLNVESAVDEDGPTRVAEYRLVREGIFRKLTTEE